MNVYLFNLASKAQVGYTRRFFSPAKLLSFGRRSWKDNRNPIVKGMPKLPQILETVPNHQFFLKIASDSIVLAKSGPCTVLNSLLLKVWSWTLRATISLHVPAGDAASLVWPTSGKSESAVEPGF